MYFSGYVLVFLGPLLAGMLPGRLGLGVALGTALLGALMMGLAIRAVLAERKVRG